VDATSDAVLVADGLSKSYDWGVALRSLSFELLPGRVMGFLGPNGAGKTTSIRILTTIMEPTSGRFTIDGIGSDNPAAIRPRIGVLPESLGLPNQITGLEYLTYFERLYGRTRSDARAHSLSLITLVGLRAKAGRLIRTYSHGMRQRLGIARALVNDPVVLFLDEPVVGLDPRGQQDLLDLMREIATVRAAGIILCSHSLSDVESACDDVVILSSGRVVASGPIADVVARSSASPGHPTVIRLHLPPSAMDGAVASLRRLDAIDDVSTVGESGLRVVIRGGEGTQADDGGADRLLRELMDAGVPVLGFEIEGSRLADVFMELTDEGAA
jgi:ABC-2 type transport system ATP-binding protein